MPGKLTRPRRRRSQCDSLGLFVHRPKGRGYSGDDLLVKDQGPLARAAGGRCSKPRHRGVAFGGRHGLARQ
jgi:hypothetical protein